MTQTLSCRTWSQSARSILWRQILSKESFLTLKADIFKVKVVRKYRIFHSKVSRVASNREPN